MAKTIKNAQMIREPQKYGLHGPLASKFEAHQKLCTRYMDEVTQPKNSSARGMNTSVGETTVPKSTKSIGSM